MNNVLFIAGQYIHHQLRDRSTLLWLLVMPPIFFYFIGTVTGGFSAGSGEPAAIEVTAPRPGFLQEQVDLRLRQNDFAPEWVASDDLRVTEDAPVRTLTFAADLSDRVRAGKPVKARFATQADSLRRDFEIIRIQRSLYTVLADIAVADAASAGQLDRSALAELNRAPRIWQLDTRAAGERRTIPSGFDQSVPGMLVMFTLLVLLTNGATMLVLERRQGLLRRLASAPISRTELVAGKLGGHMALAAVQIGVALVFGTIFFGMDWGPDPGMVIVVLAAWGAFCAAAGLWLGSIAQTEGQAGGLGVLTANALAALGGCWWPIEITPGWMQAVQNFLPTGWAMDALHKLVSFQAGAASALPQLALLVSAAAIAAALAIRRFRYQ